MILMRIWPLLLLALLLTGCGGGTTPEKESSSPAAIDLTGNRNLPFFSLPSATAGSIVKSEMFQGQVLLVAFFTTWCKSCAEEVDGFKKLQTQYGGRRFSLLALSLDNNDREAVENFIDKTGINYPVLLADKKTATAFGGIATIPTLFLVDRKGKLRKKYLGHVETRPLEADIESLL